MDITELQRLGGVQPIIRHPWESARAGIISVLLKKFKPNCQSILDAGSGDAFVLRILASKKIARRYDAVDTAYTKDLLQKINTVAGMEGIRFHSDYQVLSAETEKADCCLLLDVLEHCEDDQETLRSLTDARLTTPDATFIITVPAFQSLFSGHDRLLQHYRRYSRKQLTGLCKKEGLELIASGYFFSILLPARWFQLIAERTGIRKTRSSLDGWKGSRLFSRLFYAILWADFRICFLLSRIGIKIPGLSVYCICRKQQS